MSGFAVSVARAALPDTGLLSVTEMLDQGRSICDISFEALRDIVGFDAYDALLASYETGRGE